MSNALDMSLDDLIKNSKKSGGANLNGRRRRSSALGTKRRQLKRSGSRPALLSHSKVPESTWQKDMYSDRLPANTAPVTRAVSSIETGSKIYISNLDYGVSNEDIKELFSDFGDLKRSSVHYDRSGRSKGTAEVVFARKVDAVAAVKRYNDVQLDGKPMKINIVGTNVQTPSSITRMSGGGFGISQRISRRVSKKPDSATNSTGRRGRGGRGRGKGLPQVSASDLDADLEKYHTDAMQQ